MRLGWSVICRGFERHDNGTLTLQNAFADTILTLSIPQSPPVQVPLRPSIFLVSYWFIESDAEKRNYSAVLRILAPGDNHELLSLDFDIDLSELPNKLVTINFAELLFVGNGLYEFHVEVIGFGSWEVTSQNSVYIVGIIPESQ